MAPISQDNNFLIVLTNLGTVKSMIEMSTTDYAIVGGLTFSEDNSKDFVKTNDIQTIAKIFNVPSTDLPTGDVFYYAGKYRMATDGVALVTITITDDFDFTMYYWNYQFGSETNTGCNPLVSIANWYEHY